MAGRTFLGTLRLALLLAVLAFVALGAWLDRTRSRDWDATLRVTVYPLPAADEPAVGAYAASLTDEDFDAVEEFFAGQAQEHGVALDEPVRVRVSHDAHTLPPALPERPGPLSIALWSLRLRYYAARIAWNDSLPPPDVQVFVTYSPTGPGMRAVPDSVGLTKGLVAVAHLYGDSAAAGSNQVVLAHELLHTLGATDKYEPTTGVPRAADGLGEPDREPLYPQRYGEIMAGRIALAANEAIIADDLAQMVVGPLTAREIGWAE